MAACTVCNKKLTPTDIIHGERFYHECDWCLQTVCEEHSDIDEEAGTCKCTDCITQAIIDKENGRIPKSPMI